MSDRRAALRGGRCARIENDAALAVSRIRHFPSSFSPLLLAIMPAKGQDHMEAIRLRQRIRQDGELRVSGLPCQKGDEVELILLLGLHEQDTKDTLTASALRGSPLVGLWKTRRDIADSGAYARALRVKIERRRR